MGDGQLYALMQAIFAAWALGCVLLAALMVLPSLRPRIKPLWPLMASELLILAIGVFVLPWDVPLWPQGIVLAGAAYRIGYEAGHVYGLAAGRSVAIPAGFALSLAVAAVWLLPLPATAIQLAGLLAFAATVASLALRDWSGPLAVRFFLYPMLPFLAFVATARAGQAATMVLAFLLVELFDSFSLLGGKLFGRTLLVPKLSPHKTWEGLATGLLAVVASSCAVAWFLGAPTLHLVVVALAVALAALVGDLAASAIKRRAGVKDYPTVLPVQGGLLDIMDSWIVAAPVAVLVLALLQEIGR